MGDPSRVESDLMTQEPVDPEQDLIRAFVSPMHRHRLLELLGRPARREKLRQRLAHCRGLDPRFTHLISSSEQSPDHIERLLRKKGAPDRCHVISENVAIDGREMPLSEALQEIVGNGMGTLVSCIPGRLGYYEAEEPNERYLLERSS